MGDRTAAKRSNLRGGDITDPYWLGVEAKRMAKWLIRHAHRGPGDTVERAAHQVETEYGAPAVVILQCWNRPPREMLVSRWMAVFAAYCCARAEAPEDIYERHRRGSEADDCHPVLLRLADLVAGRASAEGLDQP